MKIALLGKGKTGSKALELNGADNTLVFDSKNPFSIDKANGCDVIISFLPGDVFVNQLDLLLESKIPVVTGSTGFEWPVNFSKKIEEKKIKWIKAHNFSIGMNLVYKLIKIMSKTNNIFSDYEFKLHEIHHTNKKDAPSGTALSWNEWLSDSNIEITSERTGDVVGDHELVLETPFEDISIRHKAKDRKIFASGALWAAKKIITDSSIPYGLTDLSTLALKELE